MNLKKIIASALLLTFLSSCKDCEAKRTSNPNHIKQLLTTKKCPKCDLGGADLTNADLAGADLREAELSNAKLLIIGEIGKVKLPSHKGFSVSLSVAKKWIKSSLTSSR
ncbi:hypothetical protein NIES4075_39650 [Tolypothrix sp. NIES-4075]|uniref:pentapeptide repeat-containing protein n=1 Tax=Tolypothrix sp. NIES-4075 TaxID=2005459 RepID=UPI000B5C8F8B|nr:pentapeptide repeat-containing protein [Tolypothrix sp. NIES-4075]GAX42959.1 hypothetical protein NIES4075_39650 [Tolypothrix sp. NIES-4075]